MAVGPFLLAAFAAASSPPSPTDLDVRESGCQVLVADEAGKVNAVAMPGLHVLRQAAADGPFRPSLPKGARAILCSRSSIIPAEHDDEVLALGVTLFLKELPPGRRLGVLEQIDGSFRYRLLEGRFRHDEEPMLQPRIDLFNRRGKPSR